MFSLGASPIRSMGQRLWNHMFYFHFLINVKFCYYNIGLSTTIYELCLLHIANFQFIESLDCINCIVEHLHIAKYAQIFA
jgi:hypothetical protein